VSSRDSIWGPAMTDAALPVTQSAVEQFTERYLRSLGYSVEKQGNRWNITVPEDGFTASDADNFTLVTSESDDVKEGEEVLGPDSSFFQQLLEDISKHQPRGQLSITDADTDIEAPVWLSQSAVEVREIDFTPYYDRTAVVFLFRIGIETVSEYQREYLRAVAIDVRSEGPLPLLEETFLKTTSISKETVTEESSQLDADQVRKLSDIAHGEIADRMEQQIDEIHQEASRAADAEVEEYRNLEEQRIQELEEKHERLGEQIDDLGGVIDTAGREGRVEALKKRKELKREHDEVSSKLQDLRERREIGFRKTQREIRERHALDVRIKPLTVTEVEYERGEIDVELCRMGTTETLTLGYGNGAGVTEEIRCESCDLLFSEQNPVHTIDGMLRCRACAVGDE